MNPGEDGKRLEEQIKKIKEYNEKRFKKLDQKTKKRNRKS